MVLIFAFEMIHRAKFLAFRATGSSLWSRKVFRFLRKTTLKRFTEYFARPADAYAGEVGRDYDRTIEPPCET